MEFCWDAMVYGVFLMSLFSLIFSHLESQEVRRSTKVLTFPNSLVLFIFNYFYNMSVTKLSEY